MVVESNLTTVTSVELTAGFQNWPFHYARRGITDKQIDQLLLFSQNDPQIGEFTHDRERFKSRPSFKLWAARRIIYSLSDFGNNLHGIFWFGEMPLPTEATKDEIEAEQYPITFAARLYGQIRGRGLAVPFIKDVLNRFFQNDHIDSNRGIWLRTDPANRAALRSFSKVGFRDVTKDGFEDFRVMVLELS